VFSLENLVSKVIPIVESGDVKEAANYSMCVPVIAKVVEVLMNDQVSSHFESNKLMLTDKFIGISPGAIFVYGNGE
jgi:hypothetical protein